MVALTKAAKSAKLAMQSLAIVTEQLKQAEAISAKIVKKRNIKVKYII